MSETTIPGVREPVWKEIVTGQRTIGFEFLAANILTRRLRELYNSEPSDEKLQMCILQLRELFVRNSELASVKKDIYKISNMES